MDPAPARTPLRRHLRRAAAGTCAGVVALPLALLRPLDRAPWHEDPAARPALAAAEAMHRQAAAARPAPLEAGWAAVPLDLREGDPLAGYGARKGAPSAGGGEGLEARALFLRAGDAELVQVTADVLLIHAATGRRREERSIHGWTRWRRGGWMTGPPACWPSTGRTPLASGRTR